MNKKLIFNKVSRKNGKQISKWFGSYDCGNAIIETDEYNTFEEAHAALIELLKEQVWK